VVANGAANGAPNGAANGAVVGNGAVNGAVVGNGAPNGAANGAGNGAVVGNGAANGGGQAGDLAAATSPGKPAATKLQVFSNTPTFTITAPLTVINSTLRSSPAILYKKCSITLFSNDNDGKSDKVVDRYELVPGARIGRNGGALRAIVLSLLVHFSLPHVQPGQHKASSKATRNSVLIYDEIDKELEEIPFTNITSMQPPGDNWTIPTDASGVYDEWLAAKLNHSPRSRKKTVTTCGDGDGDDDNDDDDDNDNDGPITRSKSKRKGSYTRATRGRKLSKRGGRGRGRGRGDDVKLPVPPVPDAPLRTDTSTVDAAPTIVQFTGPVTLTLPSLPSSYASSLPSSSWASPPFLSLSPASIPSSSSLRVIEHAPSPKLTPKPTIINNYFVVDPSHLHKVVHRVHPRSPIPYSILYQPQYQTQSIDDSLIRPFG
jgi:hypothetical protein